MDMTLGLELSKNFYVSCDYHSVRNLPVMFVSPGSLQSRHTGKPPSNKRRILQLATAPSMWQARGPGTACRLVSCRHHLCPHSGASSRHCFLPAPLYLRTLWRYTNAAIIIIII